MHAETTSLEAKSQQLEKDKQNLKEELMRIFRNRTKLTEAQLRANQLPPFVREQCFFLPPNKTHLYQWLLQEAYRMIQLSPQDARKHAQEKAQHESEHAAVMPKDKQHWYGIRFFAVMDADGAYQYDSLQPFVYLDKAETLAPAKIDEIALNPTHDSQGDIRQAATN